VLFGKTQRRFQIRVTDYYRWECSLTNPEDGLGYYAIVWIHDPTTGGAGSLRGRMRGFYNFLHAASSFADNDYGAGVGDLAGSQIRLIKTGRAVHLGDRGKCAGGNELMQTSEHFHARRRTKSGWPQGPIWANRGFAIGIRIRRSEPSIMRSGIRLRLRSESMPRFLDMHLDRGCWKQNDHGLVQASGKSLSRPSLIVKANPLIGVNADVTSVAGSSTGWIQIAAARSIQREPGPVCRAAQ